MIFQNEINHNWWVCHVRAASFLAPSRAAPVNRLPVALLRSVAQEVLLRDAFLLS